MWIRTIPMLVGLLLSVCASGAAGQTAKPLSPEDAVRAYNTAQISRSAVRDQLDLCGEDADKLDQVYTKLRPDGGADRGDWTDWGDLYRRTAMELQACLRSYSKQMVLHGRDIALLRERLPLLREPKRLTISPKQVAGINAYVAGLDKELSGYVTRARAMANGAELASGRVGALLREAGVAKVEVPKGFADGL